MIPATLGFCRDDLPRIAEYVNLATQKLINTAGDSGWWGCYHKILFSVNRDDPYITLPAMYSGLIGLAPCRPMPIRNQFYEFLDESSGFLPNPNGSSCQSDFCGTGAAYDRANVSTFVDLTPTGQYLRTYITDARDVGSKILVSGATDQNGIRIYSTDVNEQVDGILLVLQTPFTTSSSIITSFQTIGKSVTYGDVLLKSVDAATGDEVLLSRYTASETNPAYRRYYLRSLPQGCCNAATPGNVLVSALAKVEYAPIYNSTDYCLIGNLPALKAECESIRYSLVDNAFSQQMSVTKHLLAVRELNNELRHYNGTGMAVTINPAYRDGLRRTGVGMLN